MKRAIAFVSGVFIVAFAIGCGGRPAEDKVAASSPPVTTRPGEIALPPDSPKLREIRVGTVETAQVPSEEVDAPGKIDTNPSRVSHVLLPLAGRISSVLVALGDSVKRGQPVVLLESPDADAATSAYLTAQAAVNTAKSVLLKSQADYDRVKDLYDHNAIAKKEVINAESAMAQAKAALEQSEAAESQAQRKLDLLGLKRDEFGQKVVVRAPIAGKVLEITVAPGEYRNDTNASLMTIADLSTVWVSSDVPESQIRFIRPGERLDLELTAFPGQTFHARVTRIADTVDPQTRTIKVRAEIDNSRGLLRPEMYGSVRHVESTREMPVVPAGAVVQSEGQNLVYKETAPGRFQTVPVELGSKVGDRIAVTSGLSKGDRIVTDGVMLLKST